MPCAAASASPTSSASPGLRPGSRMRAARWSCRCSWAVGARSWGAWIRTRDHGTKTRCLTTWPRPTGRAAGPSEYTERGAVGRSGAEVQVGLEAVAPGRSRSHREHRPVDGLFGRRGAIGAVLGPPAEETADVDGPDPRDRPAEPGVVDPFGHRRHRRAAAVRAAMAVKPDDVAAPATLEPLTGVPPRHGGERPGRPVGVAGAEHGAVRRPDEPRLLAGADGGKV